MTADVSSLGGDLRAPLHPSVGVVVPVHDGEAYLGEALQSLADQDLAADQVVVVDDASRDRSVDVARSFQDRLPLEIVRLDAQRGVSAARNAGVARLRTQLVGFLDADDVWMPTHLERVVEAYQRNGGLISPAALIWYPDGSTRPFHRWLGLRVPRGRRQLPALLQHNFVFVGSLVPRSDLQAVGGFREPNVGEDWDLWIRLLARGLRVTQLHEPTVRYRRHGANTTNSRARMIPSIVDVLERAEAELGARYEPAVRRSIRRHLAELELEQRLAAAAAGAGRLDASALPALFRASSRVSARALVLGLAPRMARRVSRERSG